MSVQLRRYCPLNYATLRLTDPWHPDKGLLIMLSRKAEVAENKFFKKMKSNTMKRQKKQEGWLKDYRGICGTWCALEPFTLCHQRFAGLYQGYFNSPQMVNFVQNHVNVQTPGFPSLPSLPPALAQRRILLTRPRSWACLVSSPYSRENPSLWLLLLFLLTSLRLLIVQIKEPMQESVPNMFRMTKSLTVHPMNPHGSFLAVGTS